MEESLIWRKSSYTSHDNCVEVAFASAGVAVRDSKQPGGPRLSFPAGRWSAFLSAAVAPHADEHEQGAQRAGHGQ